jgi:CHASE2 domain-containing sensor protein/signal transduction histidine kinase
MRQVALREWCLIAILLLWAAIALGMQNGLGRLDQTLYDRFASMMSRPARDDIIIVAIDDYSLSQLGRWPWPRTHHADLIRKLTKAGARTIGLDVILSEPEQPQPDGSRPGDAALAAAIRANGHTILPLTLAGAGFGIRVSPPIDELGSAARGIAHINLDYDSDGVVRSVFMHEGGNDYQWPQMSLALANPVAAATYAGTAAHSGLMKEGWYRHDKMQIAFAGGNGHFQSVPYVSVLRGEVPDEFFKGKYVLIGATASGMTDSYPTAVSGFDGAMPGVEIHANILADLLDGKSIMVAMPWQTAVFCSVPVLIALLCYLLLPPRGALLVSGVMLVAILSASYLAMRAGWWLPPAAGLFTLLAAYPLWSWRRLEAAIAYLGQEFMRLDHEPHLLPEVYPSHDRIEDVLEHRINAMKKAARRVRDLRRFISDSLDSLPDATVITNAGGHVVLANQAAHRYFASLGIADIDGASLLDLLHRLHDPQPIDQPALEFDWMQLLDSRKTASLGGVSASDAQGRDLLVKSAPCRSAMNLLTGWIVSVIDISPIRSAERSRDETLRFLSHDMRAPQASILALLELQHEPSSALESPEFFSRIEKAARRTLGLADNFVQLARAESQEYRLEEVDFQDLAFDATDEMWTLAQNKHIKLVTEIEEGDFPVKVDRALMTRVLVNLLSNAINYSPENTCVTCTLSTSTFSFASESNERQIACSVKDQGVGIAPADQARLFQRFQRFATSGPVKHDGIGLGLVFVKTVVERHHGKITFSSAPGVGTTFTITLPCYTTRLTESAEHQPG